VYPLLWIRFRPHSWGKPATRLPTSRLAHHLRQVNGRRFKRSMTFSNLDRPHRTTTCKRPWDHLPRQPAHQTNPWWSENRNGRNLTTWTTDDGEKQRLLVTLLSTNKEPAVLMEQSSKSVLAGYKTFKHASLSLLPALFSIGCWGQGVIPLVHGPNPEQHSLRFYQGRQGPLAASYW
jgi:hypothetical protein